MTDRLTALQHRSKFSLKTLSQVVSSTILAIGLLTSSALAKDPFRTTNPRAISDKTEAAFEAFFKQGDYKAAANYLAKTDSNEPLALSMKATLAYSDILVGRDDKDKQARLLAQFREFGIQTRRAAEKLLSTDPLRGNMYLAVSHFFDGVYAFTKDGTIKGTPQVLKELQQVIKYLDAAEAIAPNDPELNLLRGYMDVYTGTYLPFASADKGIERLQKYASPRYLAERGLAMGYLEMKQYDKALSAVDRAIALTPTNPEIQYLKAKILTKQGKDQESLTHFDKAMSKKDQLPLSLVREIERAQRKTKERLAGGK
jgi:tetratricopeptide (TPR) repeat protein